MTKDTNGTLDAEPARSGERTRTWMDGVDQMLDEAVARDEGLELTAEDLSVEVPLRFGPDAPRAEWGFDGSVRIDVEGERGPLAEWLRLWGEQLPKEDE